MIRFLIETALAADPQPREAKTFLGSYTDIGEFVSDIYSWILPIATVGAVILIVVSGYQILTSQGNDSAVADAKKNIAMTLGGLILLYMIKILINILIVNYTV